MQFFSQLASSSFWQASPTQPHVIGSKGPQMTLDYFLGAAVTLFVLGYLVYALLRPERF